MGVALLVGILFMLNIGLDLFMDAVAEKIQDTFGKKKVEDPENPAALVGTFKRYKWHIIFVITLESKKFTWKFDDSSKMFCCYLNCYCSFLRFLVTVERELNKIIYMTHTIWLFTNLKRVKESDSTWTVKPDYSRMDLAA